MGGGWCSPRPQRFENGGPAAAAELGRDRTAGSGDPYKDFRPFVICRHLLFRLVLNA